MEEEVRQQMNKVNRADLNDTVSRNEDLISEQTLESYDNEIRADISKPPRLLETAERAARGQSPNGRRAIERWRKIWSDNLNWD